jgi:hypothetical protein
MDSKQLIALLIIVVMAASTIGFTVFYNFPDQENNGNQPPPIGGEPTEMVFSAEKVPATVSELLPSIRITAETTATDISSLMKAIYAIEGIRKANGRFQAASETMFGAGFVFVGDISFDADLNSSRIIELLGQQAGLRNIDGLQFALVELPKKVIVFNADVNISRDLNLSENVSEALVGFAAIKEDELLLGINATFFGATLRQLDVFETLNITAEPVAKTALLSVPIKSLENRLLFGASVSFSQFERVSDLNAQIRSISGFVDANLEIPELKPEISVSSDVNLSTENANDLNKLLYDLNAAKVDISTTPLSATILFHASITGSQFEQKLAMVKQIFKLSSIDAVIEQSSGFLFGQIELSSSDSRQPAADLNALLGGISAQVKQPGSLAVNEIFDSDSSKTLLVPNGEISALLLPGHSVGEQVAVNVEYDLVRGEIASAHATEE